ncbi:GTPase family protein [Leptolyngbya sp. FACHB-261]|uniref:GTPase family protein n=1 Tax=Leptolyngbya sp. FACHB-261 TaxID=2692806 RepID=UPI00168312A6|nr:GTPase domain-containing protein [Leptolyngbya sp. FACHB-261]MBD2100872.1 GTPase domain-containing protein [Leptolyngbya sp. FACHB-261]
MTEISKFIRSAPAKSSQTYPTPTDTLSSSLNQCFSQEPSQDTQLIVVGDAGVGKSTLLNALLGQEAAWVSFGKQTTQVIRPYRLSSPVGDLVLYDSPGLGSHHDRGEDKATLANIERLLPQCDVILIVIDAVSRQHQNVARLYRNYLARRSCLDKVIFVLTRCDAIPVVAGPDAGRWDERNNCPDHHLNRTIHNLIQTLKGDKILAVESLPTTAKTPTMIAVSAARRWNLVSLLKRILDVCQTPEAKLNLLLQARGIRQADVQVAARPTSGPEDYTLENLITDMSQLFGSDMSQLFGEP